MLQTKWFVHGSAQSRGSVKVCLVVPSGLRTDYSRFRTYSGPFEKVNRQLMTQNIHVGSVCACVPFFSSAAFTVLHANHMKTFLRQHLRGPVQSISVCDGTPHR